MHTSVGVVTVIAWIVFLARLPKKDKELYYEGAGTFSSHNVIWSLGEVLSQCAERCGVCDREGCWARKDGKVVGEWEVAGRHGECVRWCNLPISPPPLQPTNHNGEHPIKKDKCISFNYDKMSRWWWWPWEESQHYHHKAKPPAYFSLSLSFCFSACLPAGLTVLSLLCFICLVTYISLSALLLAGLPVNSLACFTFYSSSLTSYLFNVFFFPPPLRCGLGNACDVVGCSVLVRFLASLCSPTKRKGKARVDRDTGEETKVESWQGAGWNRMTAGRVK